MTPTKKDRAQELLEEGFRIMNDAIKNPDRYPEKFIMLRMESLHGVFSPQRARLIQYLQKHGPVGSVEALAEALHRKVPAVSRDINLLSGYLLVDVRPVGRRKEISARDIPILLR